MSITKPKPRKSPFRWFVLFLMLVGTFVTVQNLSRRFGSSSRDAGGNDGPPIQPVSLAGSRVDENDYAAFMRSLADEPAASENAAADDPLTLVQANSDESDADRSSDDASNFGLSAPILDDGGSEDRDDGESTERDGESDDDSEIKPVDANTDAESDQSKGDTPREENSVNANSDSIDDDEPGPPRTNPLYRDTPASPSDLGVSDDESKTSPAKPAGQDRRPRRLTPKLDDDVPSDRRSASDNLPAPRRLRRPDEEDRQTEMDETDVASADLIEGIDPLENNRRGENDPAWHLTLADAIAIGLQSSPEIDLVEFDPGIQSALVGVERGEFDPVGGVSVNGGQDDRLARSEVDTFDAPVDFRDTDFFTTLNGLNNVFVRQRLMNGASYEFGFGTDYRRFSPVGLDLLIPSGWESSINFQFNQPLLRGRGRAVTLRRLLVAKALTEEAGFETQARVREIVRNIELAYWELAGAYARLKVATKFVELGGEFESQEDQRQRLGLSARPQQLQTQSLLSDFRVALQQARRDANVAEMRLRTAMGVTAELYGMTSIASPHAFRQLPIQVDIAESVMPVDMQLDPALSKAMTRPAFGVIRARQLAARHNLAAARNGLLPQLDATALYQKTGLNDNLDNSVSTLFNERFDTWAVGLTYQQSAYRRSAKASVRRFQLTLGQEQARMAALTNTVAGDLARFKADVEGSYETFVARRRQVDFLTEQVEALNELYKDDQVSLFQRLEITRSLQAAEVEAIEAWARMQQSTAQWRFTRGDSPGDYGIPVVDDHRGMVVCH